MSRRIGSAVLFVVASTAMAAFAQTQPQAPQLTGVLKRINDSGVLSVGYAESSMPFSYYDQYKNPIGYSIDVCKNVIDAIKAELKKPTLKVEMHAIKADDAVSYLVSGVVDIHCGPILNTWEKKSRVEFGTTYFVQRFRYGSHESAHMNEIDDMFGRTWVTTNASPAMNALQALSNERGWNLTIIPARTFDDAFRIFRENGAQGILLDEISLAYGISKFRTADPSMVMISDAAFGAQPFSLIYVKGDAPFKRVIVDAMQKLYAGGNIRSIYGRWFTSPIPPDGLDLSLRVSPTLDRIFQQPTDSPDPALYE
jgi:glutamate/aspartate transport system substrate-binding protein